MASDTEHQPAQRKRADTFTETYRRAERRRQRRATTSDPARASRTRWLMMASAGAVMLYALITLAAAARSPHLGFFTMRGSPILAVEDGSPADRAGMQRGDRIVAIDGVEVDELGQHDALLAIEPGQRVAFSLARGGARVEAALVAERTTPIASAAGILFAALLLMLALIADRGASSSVPRLFFRNTLLYIVLLAGMFSHDTALREHYLLIPWLFAIALAAPATCHHLLRFPAGPDALQRWQLAAIYAPPVALALVMTANHLSFIAGAAVAHHARIGDVTGWLAGAMSAVYLTLGAVTRARRLRRKGDEVDPVARRWLYLGGLFQAIPLIAGALWAVRDVGAFIAGGFRPFVAITMIGSCACLTLAITRTPFGELDRMWRRSSGYFLATSLAAGLYLLLIGLLGGAASTLSGGSFHTALAATLFAAVVFGPLRRRLQAMVDVRFARDRSRARRLLREAAEAAAATLDIHELRRDIVARVEHALRAEGAALYIREDDDAWRREVATGAFALGARFGAGSPAGRQLDAAVESRGVRALPGGPLGVPLATKDSPAALVVAPPSGRGFHDEDVELLVTAGANLVVALDNARRHAALVELTEALRREVEVAEARRREIARLKERVEAENRELVAKLAARSGGAPVIGRGLEPTFELAQKVARSDANVLLRGETGVGKELFARAIHAASPRRDGPFIVVDCGAIAAGVFESALFGHVKGAFTGAVKDALGAFRAAEGGTIFLDEIGELPLALQPALLRVLQEREVHPVGSSTPIAVDVRVIAGTNRDLAAEVTRGAFRQDLLYRLQVVEIVVPPLRQRRGDIPALAEHFAELHARRGGRPVKRLATDAIDALMEHDWPGNVRELEHAIEAGAVYADGDEIRAADLPIFDDVFRKKGKRAITDGGAQVQGDGAPRAGLREKLEDLECQRLIEALAEHGGNKTRTARALGMSRGALLRRIKRYQLSA